jgi:S-adenosylmethionine synthetase
MTLEAAAGKNPRNHVGKIYSIAAQQIADQVAGSIPGVRAAQVCLVSQIGKPIESPLAVDIEVVAEDLESARIEAECIAQQTLVQLPNLWQRVMRREFSLY